MLRGVVIDDREPAYYQKLQVGGLSAQCSTLPTGDAWLACDDAMIIVERKSLSDLCASIADGRLLNQAHEMRQQSEWSYIVVVDTPVISGDKVVINGRSTNWSWHSVQGALLTCQELGANTIWCESPSSYAATLEWLANRNRGDVHIKARRDVIIQTPAEQILSAVPGIGSGRVNVLLQHCGNAASALTYLTTSGGGSVPGIGPATKAAARNALGLPDDMVLSIMSRDDFLDDPTTEGNGNE